MDLYATGNEKYYNRSFSIIQSSGMGKSRLVDYSARLRFTFPFNVHEQMPSGLKGMQLPIYLSIADLLLRQHTLRLITMSAIISLL